MALRRAYAREAGHVALVILVTSLAGVTLVWAAAGWYGHGTLIRDLLPVLVDVPDILFDPYIPTAGYLALVGFLAWHLWPPPRRDAETAPDRPEPGP